MWVLSLPPSSTQRSRRAADSLGADPDPTAQLAGRILSRLQPGPLPLRELEANAPDDGSTPADQALFLLVLQSLVRADLVALKIVSGQTPVARMQGALPDLLAPPRGSALQLSRFACLRPHHGNLIVESPFQPARVVLLGEAGAAVCARLAQGTTLAELSASPSSAIEGTALQELVSALWAVGALAAPAAGDADALTQWEPHDAMFHARTRIGRTLGPQGGTYRFMGQRPPEPALPKRAFGASVALPQTPLNPDAVALQQLLRRRRSVRTYDTRPIRAADLGTLLRLVARNLSGPPTKPDPEAHYETLRRAYPAGGSCHELHVYPVINRCTGLGRGVYWYDGATDQLVSVAALGDAGERLLKDAARSMGSASAPDILLCLAARFRRVNWKYEAIAYALILKNVGVLLQTLYLAATALQLAPCALGCGNARDFLLATGNRPFEEESVGEFALGSLPAAPP